MKGAERIVAERQRQIEVEGYDPERDEDPRQLALAAAAYLLVAGGRLAEAKVIWPWPMEFFKPRDFARDVERGGALAAAALDGHDLLAATSPATETARSVVRSDRRCRRHEWVLTYSTPAEVDQYVCARCPAIRDDSRSRRGKSSRDYGNRAELKVYFPKGRITRGG